MEMDYLLMIIFPAMDLLRGYEFIRFGKIQHKVFCFMIILELMFIK